MEKYIFRPKDLPCCVDGDGVEAYARERVEACGYVIVGAGWKKGVVLGDYYEVVCEPKPTYWDDFWGVRPVL
jgi:hypothetical protein